MAPRIGKAKAHKPKGDKRKAEKVVVPLDFDIGVILPDESQVVLKGISTDRILDVRRLLSVHAETCHLTNYSLHHEVRGARIPDGYEVASLKPPIFTLVEEDYNQDQAVAHVRRLLDIISCTTHFGDSAKRKEIRTVERSKLAESSEQVVSEGTRFGVEKEDEEIIPFDSTADQGRRGGLLFTSAKRDTHEHDQDNSVLVSSAAVQDEEQAHQVTSVVPVTAVAAAREATERGDIFGLCPPSDLGRFYEFFSLSHLTRPIQSLCRSTKLETQGQEFYFGVEVRLCNGKLLIVAACAKGFQSCSKQFLQRRTLVALLKSSSQAFSKAYDELLEGFLERNKFGNIPYGLRSNTWVVPPVAANAPWDFPPTPAEDETWGGNGGGQGHCGAGKDRPWAEQFAIIAKMACETVEQRLIRDKKAFLLHNLFVDVAVTASAEVVKQWDEERSSAEQVYQQEVRNLIVRVSRDVDDASKKAETKIEGSHLSGKTPVELAERNLLKGITANQNTTVHDIYTLGAVVVRHRGYIAVVEASGLNTVQSEGLPDDFEIEAQPEGGVNALNVNSLRTLLHTSSDLGAGGVNRVKVGSGGAHAIVEKVIEDSLVGLMSELTQSSPFIRLELGACWLQHLQTEGGTQESEGKPPYEVDHQQVRKVQSTSDDSVRDEEHPAGCDVSIAGNVDHHSDIFMSQLRRDDPKSQQTLRIKLGEAAYKRLQESGTGLHLQSVPELMDGVTKYHNEIVISKLVADFASLELAPIDGRTLSDFMHSRGLRMRSLGRVAELSAKLPHMQSLCEHEMVARALKHVVRAVVAAIGGIQHLASRIAVVLNFAFGTVPTRGAELLWKWVEMFVKKRFSWELSVSCRRELRPHAVLRGLCHKIGIELAPRNYNFESTEPFDKLDVVSIVPIYKHVSCSSADARTLLESCKTALDKGKGEEAISYGTKALAKLIGVCGPYHRMTAGAYSLLAVVLYHTGDYNQAMIYQQKSLDINERELGLEHPDTIKSYGDVAVFYYRLQHTELAIKYVMRALYLLHLVCGPSHPNTAATYINVAMMEEGMGNVHVSLRYLHEALKCNVKLLGAEHTQTAATYHAMAIVLSMMDAYLLSVQHEQKTLQILEGKLGPEDPRTLDSAAWLQYFDSKAVEQQEAARSGTPRVDSSIASKGHLSVSDLVEFINSEGAGEAGGHSKAKSRRTKAKSRVTSVGTSLSGRAEGDVSAAESSSAVDTRTVAGGGVMADVVPIASVTEVTNQIVANGLPVSASETEVQPETPVVGTFDRFEDDGWQSAGHKGRSANGGGRRGLKGSISVTGMGSQGIRSIPGTMGEILGAGFEPRKTAANGTYTVDAERNRKTTAVISGRALSPLGNSGGHSSAEGPSTGGSALIVKPSLSTQGVGPDATEAGRKAEDAINSPSKASAMNGNSTGVPSSVDVSSPRLSRGSLSYKEAALAPAGLGTTSKGVACPGPDGAVDGKICKLVAADGRSNGTVQGMNLPQVKVVPSTDAGAKGSQGNLDMGCKLSNGVVNGKSNVKIAETKLAEKYDVTSEEDCGEKKKPEEKKAVFSGKRWADFDMEPTDNIESSNVVNRTAGYEGTDKLPMFNGNVQKAGRIIPPADRDVQKPGRRSYWKDVDVHGSARGGSKGREDNHRPADGQKGPGIPSKAGNGWSKNTYREVDHGTKTGQSSLENGHSASENGMSARKHDLKASQYGQRVFGNGHLVLENGEESSVVVHEVLESGQVEMNELGKNGFNHTNGHEAEKQTDGQLTTTRGNAGEKAVWNIKFGGVVESDMDIDPVGGSRSSTSSPKEIVECAVEIGSTNGAEVDQVEHRELSEATDNDNVNLLEAQSCVPSEQKISSCEQYLEDEVCDEAEQASDSMQLPPESNGTEDKSDLSQVETSHDAGKRLSASAPPFTPTVSPGSRVVAAVTPFKGGKAPFVPVSLPAVRPPAISSIHNTIAVTPIRKVGPTLASPVPSNQLQGVVVASNQPPPVFILPPATAAQGQLPASLATGPGEVKVLETDSLSGHARLTMNPNAKEFVPRTMNPNAAVFVPGRAWPSAGLQGAHRCTQCGMGTEQVGSVGLESYGNASWDDSVMTFGADGIPAEESGDSTNVSEEKEQFVAGIGGNHGFEKSLGSFEGNSELEGSSEEDGSSFTEKYDEPVLFGNTADVIGTWKQEIPCM